MNTLLGLWIFTPLILLMVIISINCAHTAYKNRNDDLLFTYGFITALLILFLVMLLNQLLGYYL